MSRVGSHVESAGTAMTIIRSGPPTIPGTMPAGNMRSMPAPLDVTWTLVTIESGIYMPRVPAFATTPAARDLA